MRGTWILSTVVVAAAVAVGTLVRPTEVCGAAETPAFAGAASCKSCHLKQHKSWKNTAMAKTFESLMPGKAAEKKTAAGLDPATDFTKDEKCLKCHTTGFGEAGGFPKPGTATTPEQQKAAEAMQGVSCEACHGPGSLYGPYKKEHKDYKREEIVKLGAVTPPTAEVCSKCHVKECPTMPADYAFQFEEAVKKTDKIHEHIPLKNPH
jgi:hypothetical protein